MRSICKGDVESRELGLKEPVNRDIQKAKSSEAKMAENEKLFLGCFAALCFVPRWGFDEAYVNLWFMQELGRQ